MPTSNDSNNQPTLLGAWRGSVLALAALMASTGWSREASPLGEPTQSIDQLLPGSVIDGFTLPDKPLRVAARPTPQATPKPTTDVPLDWRPSLRKASERIAKSNEASTPAALPKTGSLALAQKNDSAESDEAPGLLRVAQAPKLIAPRTGSKPEVQKKASSTDRDEIVLPAPSQAEANSQSTQTAPTQKAEPEPAPVRASPKKTKPAIEEPLDKAEPKANKAPAKVKQPPAPLSRSMRNLRSRMRTVLSFYYRKPFNTVEYDPWEIMHGMLAYELHSRVRDGGPKSPMITSIGHLCFNRPSKRQQMIHLNEQGELDVRVGVGLQGHKGQFLAMLAQCNVSPDYPIRVSDKEFTIHDLIEAEQRSCYVKTELTFKLIGLGHYLDSDAKWLNEQGENWDIPKLIKEERNQPIRGAACGGTHRLAGLSLAYRRREARGEPLDGEYAEAARFVSQYLSYAFRLQNSDGSLSTEWFRGPGREEDIERRLRTTGHTLEWLAYALPDDQLTSQRTVRAASYLTSLLATNANQDWHPGSLAHALHALVLYDKRVFQPHDEKPEAEGAEGIATADQIDPTSRLYRGYSIYRGVMRNSAPEPSFFGIFGGSSQTRRPTGYRSR